MTFIGSVCTDITSVGYQYKEEVDKYLSEAERLYKKLHYDTKKIKTDFL